MATDLPEPDTDTDIKSDSELETNSASALENNHMSIVLGVGLGLVALIVMCLIFTIYFNRRTRHAHSNPKKPRKRDYTDKLRKLDAVSPTRTLEEWWAKAHAQSHTHSPSDPDPGPGPSDCGENSFVCVVCLDPVLRSHEIRELKCLHVFHRECLDKWYLQDHYNCPLCHRAYFVQEARPANDFVWMV
ncbi:hypothetical protein BJY04DRAFT_168094 [Aspergillus karnatakaensis]|uniref:putative RING finger domain protein n=1 Tax=Aspergillus karnatakaensis TaxID=1810916 RepID=UPI003CCD81FB